MIKSQTTSTSLQYRRMDTEPDNNHHANKNKAASRSKQKDNQMPRDRPKDTVIHAYSPQALDKFAQLEVSGMCHQICQEDGRLKDERRTASNAHCTQLDQRNAEALMGRTQSKNRENVEPKQFSDALEILREKKRLLNSLQFAQEDAETVEYHLETKFSDHGIRGSARTYQRFEDNVYYKEVKDRYTYSSNKSSSPLPSSQIVVLKPSPKLMETPEHVMCTCSSLHSHRRVKTKGRRAKSTYLSFKEIKRIWKLATGENGKKHHWISSVASLHKISTKKTIQKEASDDKRPGFCRREHKCDMARADEVVCGKSKSSTSGYAKHHEPDIFQEANKHPSERLRSMNWREIVECSESVRTLGRILCLPESDSCSSPVASRLNANHGSVSTERTSSPRTSVKNEKQEDVFISKVPSEPMNLDINPDRNSDRDAFGFSSMASPPHDQIIKSSFDVSSPISPQQVLDRIKDDEEHQSPVSVLDPLSMEDASSSKSIITQSSEGAMHPLQIDHEEYALVSPIDLENKCLAACRATLKVACLSLEDAPLTKSHHNTELLVECVNDVFLEFYEQQLEGSLRTSYLKPTTGTFPPEDHLSSEVVKRVKRLLILQFEQPTLDKLVGHDIAQSAWWLDTSFDTEDVMNQIVEDVLDESVMEIILMF